MYRSLLALTAAIALSGAASAQTIYVDGDDRGDVVDRTWRAPVPPRGIGDDDPDVVVRHAPRHHDGPRGGVVIHERTVTERTIVPNRRGEWPDRAGWNDGDEDYDVDRRPHRRQARWDDRHFGHDPAPVVYHRPVVVGTVIPQAIVLTPIPPRYGFSGHTWVADPYGRRVVVEPHSRRVVRVIERW